jgi:lysophospholipase L1-like esterase
VSESFGLLVFGCGAFRNNQRRVSANRRLRCEQYCGVRGRVIGILSVAAPSHAAGQGIDNAREQRRRKSGETSGEILARANSAVPEGTKIVILNVGPVNDNRRGVSPAQRQSNIASIQQQLRARHIKIVDVNGIMRSAITAGFVQNDGIHLTAEGHRRVAAGLLTSMY